MGAETDLFPIPVCSSFKEKSFNGQLCYEADMNKYKGRVDWENSLQTGLSFVVDLNEEYNSKKIIFDEATTQHSDGDLLNAFAKSEVLKTFSVHLQTISMKYSLTCPLIGLIFIPMSDPVPVVLHGEGNYGLTDVKEIKVTEEFLSLGQATTDCQSQQFKADCNTAQYEEKVASSCSCAPLNLKTFFSHQVTHSLDSRLEISSIILFPDPGLPPRQG